MLAVCVISASSCENAGAVADVNYTLENRTWSYTNKIRVPVQIEDTESLYNVQINLRHTSNYKYANVFFLVRIKNPDGKVISERKEYTLAHPDGEWLGSGSGNLYSLQLPFKSDYKFNTKGNYVFEIEQNMRDNPLKEIVDVGFRIEKSN